MVRIRIIFLGFAIILGAQTEIKFALDELEDPDEYSYTTALLDQIFSPIGLRSKITLRQRLQYSPSLNGWRILNKGRIVSPNLSLNFLLEQDPSESSLADHSVFTMSSEQIPGVDKLVVGDFNLKWGAGLLSDQSTRRSSLSPTSLTSDIHPRIRPHYSTRETDYFHGFAVEKQAKNMHAILFASNRRAMGQVKDGNFREDSDGIHPANKSYDFHGIKDLGFASVYDWQNLVVYTAVRIKSLEETSVQYEYGTHWDYAETQFLQIFTDNLAFGERTIINWSYKIKTLGLSAQYRQFRSLHSQAFGTDLAQLGSNSNNEHGLSLRLLTRPRKGLRLNYAMDLGKSLEETNLYESRSQAQHKAQLRLSRSNREWQYDWSYKQEGPNYPTDIWQGEVDYSQTIKYAISLNEQLSPGLWYRLNLKAVTDNDLWSVLVQQRVRWVVENWKLAVGYVRYNIPSHTLRISIYETGLVESFNFFTAFADGQRWFLYLRYSSPKRATLEFQLAQTTPFPQVTPLKSPSASLQLSIVL